jgi:HEPN domain-containing protein
LSTMLDEDEFGRWLQAADDEIRLARHLVGLKAYNAAVLHAEQGAQLVLKGLLRGVGRASEAWGHALAELAERAATQAGLDLDEQLRSQLAALERDYKPTRYPDASLGAGLPY